MDDAMDIKEAYIYKLGSGKSKLLFKDNTKSPQITLHKTSSSKYIVLTASKVYEIYDANPTENGTFRLVMEGTPEMDDQGNTVVGEWIDHSGEYFCILLSSC
jgi:hypothetical protein